MVELWPWNTGHILTPDPWWGPQWVLGAFLHQAGAWDAGGCAGGGAVVGMKRLLPSQHQVMLAYGVSATIIPITPLGGRQPPPSQGAGVRSQVLSRGLRVQTQPCSRSWGTEKGAPHEALWVWGAVRGSSSSPALAKPSSQFPQLVRGLFLSRAATLGVVLSSPVPGISLLAVEAFQWCNTELKGS